MAEPDRVAAADEALARLSAEDRAWLEERLVEYRDALEYFRER